MKLKIVKIKNVKSTNDTAIRLIKQNRIKPTLVTAVNQSNGKGTMGKQWISKKGNLFISIFFKINEKKINFKQYALLNAYLVKKIITKYTTKNIRIKWPNDLFFNRKKISGILQEIINYKNKMFIIIGIGINTNVTPKEKILRATSLKDINKKKINNSLILKDFKIKYENLINDIEKYNFLQIKKKHINNK